MSNLGIPLLGFPNNIYLTDDDVIHGLSTLRGIKTIGPDGLLICPTNSFISCALL